MKQAPTLGIIGGNVAGLPPDRPTPGSIPIILPIGGKTSALSQALGALGVIPGWSRTVGAAPAQ